jgi:hypothetical protein
VTQGRNIRHYAGYLSERTRSYRDTKTDWVRVSESKLEHTPVEKGLLRQTESVQRQLGALLKCDVSGQQSPMCRRNLLTANRSWIRNPRTKSQSPPFAF